MSDAPPTGPREAPMPEPLTPNESDALWRVALACDVAIRPDQVAALVRLGAKAVPRLASPVAQEAATCPTCRGSGKNWWGETSDARELPCRRCGGTGKVAAVAQEAAGERDRLLLAVDAAAVAYGRARLAREKAEDDVVAATFDGSHEDQSLAEAAEQAANDAFDMAEETLDDAVRACRERDDSYRKLSAAPIPGEEGGKP